MTYRVRFSEEARADLDQRIAFLADEELQAAENAREAIRLAVQTLEVFPFSCRGFDDAKPPRFRELIVPFGRDGYVLLFEIEDSETVTAIAVRHQREDDFNL